MGTYIKRNNFNTHTFNNLKTHPTCELNQKMESDFIRQSDGPSDINLDDENIQNIQSSQIDNSKQLLDNGEILQENTNVLDEENTNVLEPLDRKPFFFRKQT